MKIGQAAAMEEPGPSSSAGLKPAECPSTPRSTAVSSVVGSDSVESALEITLTPENKGDEDTTEKKKKKNKSKKKKKKLAAPDSPTVVIELSDGSACDPVEEKSSMFSFTGGRYAKFGSTMQDVVLPAYSAAVMTFGPPELKFGSMADAQTDDAEITHEQVEKWGSTVAEDPRAALAVLAMCHADPRTGVFRALHDAKITGDTGSTEYYGLHPDIADASLPLHQYCGRPYLFAGTSLARLAFIHKYNLVLEGCYVQSVRSGKSENKYVASFELSQAYLFFWDRLEKSGRFLDLVIAAKNGTASATSVPVPWTDPLPDRGSWPFVQRLVDKYGLVPADLYAGSPAFATAPETLNQVLTTTLREHALLIKAASTAKQVAMVRDQALGTVFRTLSIFMGSPPPPPRQVFAWRFTDAFGNARSVQCTPRAFAQDLQSPTYPAAHGDFLSRLVCIVHDPRHAEGVELVAGGQTTSSMWTSMPTSTSTSSSTSLFRPHHMLNTSMADFQMACECMLKAGYPVFLGCDGKRALHHSNGSFLDVDGDDFGLFFGQGGTTLTVPQLSKAERLRTGDSAMTHALVLTGVDVSRPTMKEMEAMQKDKTEKLVTRRWRMQRTLRTTESQASALVSEPMGKKDPMGETAVMTDAWMEEFVYLAAIDPQVLPAQAVQRTQGSTGGRYPGLSAKSATVLRTTTAGGQVLETFPEANGTVVLMASDPLAAMVE